ncbi:hypothetical protein N0S44_000180 [Escherichia coli]|nr:hypothetical protein [Escherichia coli]
MRILNMLKSLHETTKLHQDEKYRRSLTKDLACRMYMRRFEISRIGKGWDDVNREDIDPDAIFKAYMARKVFINEKTFYIDSDRELENKFTKGLWKIWCVEVFGEVLPEPPVPETYKDLKSIFDNEHIHSNFSLYDTVSEAVFYGELHGHNKYFDSMVSFDLFCHLPGVSSWTCDQHRASKIDKRKFSAQRFMQVAMSMYKLDYLGCPEPYKHFWKERAQKCLNYCIIRLMNTYILKFRNATVYDMPEPPKNEKYPPVKTFVWYKDKSNKRMH